MMCHDTEHTHAIGLYTYTATSYCAGTHPVHMDTMIDKYGDKIIGICQHHALYTVPNTGAMPSCFSEVVTYRYQLVNSHGVHAGRLDMNPIQASRYAELNNLKIIKDNSE